MSQSLFWYLFSKKLTGEASSEELLELENLLKQYPSLVYQAESIQNFWTQNKKQEPYESELAFELHLNHLKENGIVLQELESPYAPELNEKPKSNWKRRWAFPVCAVLIFLTGFYLWNQKISTVARPKSEKNYGEVSTRPGSKTKLVLPDSTVVWLNAGSKLTYSENFGTTNRNTTLSGEAFFDVKKSSVPFIIHTKDLQIKVLGTEFNVKSYPNEKTTETSLLRGRVEITLDKRPGEPFILKPNEKLVVNSEPEKMETIHLEKKEPIAVLGSITHADDSTIVETSWVDNKLIFQDESFADVAKKMERWYGVHIEFIQASLMNEHLSGTFIKETIQEALRALQLSTKFHYSVKGNNITITK